MMNNKVSVLRNDFGVVHLIVTRGISHVTKVFTFHCFSYLPSFLGIPCVDVFSSHDEATESIMQTFGSCIVKEAISLIGVTKDDDSLVFALIDEIYPCAELPGHVTVSAINKVEYLTMTHNSIEKGSKFEEFPLEEFHYFSENMDLTRPFPSFEDPNTPDREFCWNQRWRDPFIKIGEPSVCVSLIQGFASSLMFMGFTINFIVRRSVLNPGVRYIARGLNDNDEPGNECECELIYTTPNGELFTHIFRRGSVPIRWQTNNKIITVEHVITDSNISGTKKYFARLSERFYGGQIFCLCLLNDSSSNEKVLYDSFKKTVDRLRNYNTVRFYPFDLNGQLEEKGTSGAAQAIFDTIVQLANISDFSHCRSAFEADGSIKRDLVFDTRQKNALRINCADSLDRTNIASFFLSVIITSEFCRRSGLSKTVCEPFPTKNPVDDIKPEILEFLADSFVRAGDIISFLYTNTPAVKSTVIRQFSQTLDKAKSDASISMKRKLINTFNDKQRQFHFEKWTTIPFVEPNFFLDQTKLQCTSIGFPPEIIYFSGHTDECLITSSRFFVVLVPPRIRITAIYLHLVPMQISAVSESITIEGSYRDGFIPIAKDIRIPAVPEPTMLKIKVNGFFCRFIRVTFNQVDKRISVGQIGFEGSFEGSMNVHIEKDIENENVIKEFTRVITSSVKEPVTFASIQDIELQRIQLLISMKQYYECCFKTFINPSLFYPRTTPFVCPFCGGESRNCMFGYAQALPRRMTIPSSYSRSICVCNNCMETASTIVKQTETMTTNLQSVDEIPERKKYDFNTFDMQVPHVVTEKNDAYALNGCKNGIFDGSEPFKVEKSCLITLSFAFPCSLTSMELIVDVVPEEVDVLIMKENGTFDETSLCVKEGNVLFVEMMHEIIIRQAVFSISSSCAFTINRIVAHGIPRSYLSSIPKGFHGVKQFSGVNKKDLIALELDATTLTNTVTHTPTQDNYNIILCVEAKGRNDPLIFCVFYEDNEVVSINRFDVGELSHQCQLFYEVSAPKFTKMVVYHAECDRMESASKVYISKL